MQDMWDRMKFVVVFLKVLQVIGNTQEVLVRIGDTTVLNCTCISQTNGNWVGPNRSSSKTNIFFEEKLIPYTEGFRVNKKLNISNINVVGSYENRTCNLVITNFSTDDEGKYKCQYVENHTTNNHVYNVLLKRPPTNLQIENETQNNTLQVVEGSMLQLVCSVQSGKPKEVLHWITDTTVVKEGGHNGIITYRFNASSSDHMKIFICSAFNEALDHPITKQVRLDVVGKPKVTVYIIPDGNPLQEYQDAKLCCKTEGNPPATHITWIKDTPNIKILNDTRNCIPFTSLRRQHNGTYTCTARNSIGFSSATKHIRVLYPPDVSIDTTESKQTITLKCNASGDPGSYEFAEWEHQSAFGKHIRYIDNTRKGTLVLEKHNYQNSGLYNCSVKNGIPDMNGELYQKEQFMFFYKGPPVFVSNNSKTWFAQYHEDAKIIVKVFSSYNITRGLIRRHEEEQSSEAIRSFNGSTCRESMVFYNVSVLVECIELTFDLTMLENGDFGNYTVEVCNTFYCSSFEVTLVSAHKPEPPSNISLIVDKTSISLQWHPGEYNEHFVIEYRQKSFAVWQNKEYTPAHKKQYLVFIIPDLLPDTEYEIRMFARTKAGYSAGTSILTVHTRKLIENSQNFLGWTISTIVVIFAVITGGLVFAVVKMRGKRKKSHQIRPSDIEMDIHGESVDNLLYLSTEFRPSHSARNQTELNEMNIPTTGLNQSISALSNHYQEERSEEQNVSDANRIIPTQHAESSLNYAEVIFEAGPSIVHGNDDRTVYSEIDLLRLTSAIPSSSDSDEDDFMYVDGIENYNKKD